MSLVNTSVSYKHDGHYIYKYVNAFVKADVTRSFSFGEIRVYLAESILKTPTNWQVGVVRSTLNNQTIPVGIAPMLNDTQTAIVLGMSWNGNLVKKNVNFISRLLIPDPENFIKYVRFGWYSIDHFIDMINTTYKELTDELKDLYGLDPLVEPPLLYFTTQTKTFGYKLQKAYYDQALPTPVEVYYNIYYVAYVSNVDEENISGSILFAPDLRLIVRDTLHINPDPTGDYYYPAQRLTSIANWNPVTSYQLETTMQIASTYSISPDTNRINNRFILKDYSPLDLALEDGSRGAFSSETTEINYIELDGTRPINSVELFVNWISKDGEIYPLTLGPNASFEFKLVFRKQANLPD